MSLPPYVIGFPLVHTTWGKSLCSVLLFEVGLPLLLRTGRTVRCRGISARSAIAGCWLEARRKTGSPVSREVVAHRLSTVKDADRIVGA